MWQPIRQTLSLSGGSVTLHAWGAETVEAHTLDLLTLSATLGAMREDWQEFTRGDVEPGVWGTFWRLVNASLRGTALPRPLNWNDRLTLIEGMWTLNSLEEAEGKAQALAQNVQRVLGHLSRGQTTTSTSS